MTTTTTKDLDSMTQDITAFESFDDLMAAVARGYAPTLQYRYAHLGHEVEARGGSVFWRENA